eukprot:2270021-Pleurochrysis_carterae.AAC.1
MVSNFEGRFVPPASSAVGDDAGSRHLKKCNVGHDSACPWTKLQCKFLAFAPGKMESAQARHPSPCPGHDLAATQWRSGLGSVSRCVGAHGIVCRRSPDRCWGVGSAGYMVKVKQQTNPGAPMVVVQSCRCALCARRQPGPSPAGCLSCAGYLRRDVVHPEVEAGRVEGSAVPLDHGRQRGRLGARERHERERTALRHRHRRLQQRACVERREGLRA